MLARAALSGLISIIALSVAPAHSQPSGAGSRGLLSPAPLTGSGPARRFIPPDRSVAAPSSTATLPQEVEQDPPPPLQEQTTAPSASTPGDPRASVDRTGNRARRDTNHPQAAAPPSPHSLRVPAPARGSKGSIHSETTRYAALPSAPQPFGRETNARPPGGSNRPAEGHTRNTQDRTSENGACAAWRASTASWPDAETCEARVGEENQASDQVVAITRPARSISQRTVLRVTS